MAASADTIKIVEDTWAVAIKIDGLAEYFYNTLFELRPQYKTTLFKNANIKSQALMLTNMLNLAVQNIRKPDILIPQLRALGLRHCRYGCRLPEYEAGGEAFMMTLEHFFGDKFTPEVRAAWGWTYAVVQSVMVSTCDTEEGQRLLAEYDAQAAGRAIPAAAASTAAQQPQAPVLTIVAAAVAGAALSVGVMKLLSR